MFRYRVVVLIVVEETKINKSNSRTILIWRYQTARITPLTKVTPFIDLCEIATFSTTRSLFKSFSSPFQFTILPFDSAFCRYTTYSSTASLIMSIQMYVSNRLTILLPLLVAISDYRALFGLIFESAGHELVLQTFKAFSEPLVSISFTLDMI